MDQSPTVRFEQPTERANIRIRKEILDLPAKSKVLTSHVLAGNLERTSPDFLISDHHETRIYNVDSRLT